MRSELDGDKTEEEGSATEEPALQTKSDTVVASENTQDEKSPDATTEHGQTSEHMPPDGNEPLPDKTSHEDVEKDLHQVTLAVEGSTLAERDDDTKEEEEEIEIEEEEEEEEEEEDEEETETTPNDKHAKKDDLERAVKPPVDSESNGDLEDARQQRIAAVCVLRGELPGTKQLCNVWLDEVIDALYEDLSEYMEWRLTDFKHHLEHEKSGAHSDDSDRDDDEFDEAGASRRDFDDERLENAGSSRMSQVDWLRRGQLCERLGGAVQAESDLPIA
jgi:hypothetical protein